jgi:hypothetical protein
MKFIQNTDLIVKTADTFRKRLLGLMFQKTPPHNIAFFLEPCQSIHMFFMKFDLDILVLNAEYEVIALFKSLKPGQVSPYFSKARCFVEMGSGSIEAYGFELGQKIVLVEG